MARDYFINGETMVYVSNNFTGGVQEFGLSDGPIRISFNFRHKDIKVDAWGEAPPEVQFMLAWLNVSMTLVNIDRPLLDTVIQCSMANGGAGTGQLPHAGTRMGSTGNLITMGLASPAGGKPWRFFSSYLTENPLEIPLGTEKSIFQLNWRVIPYIFDPWNGSAGANAQFLWDHTSMV